MSAPASTSRRLGFGKIDVERLADVMAIRDNTAVVIELKDRHYAHSHEATLDAARAFANRVNRLNV